MALHQWAPSLPCLELVVAAPAASRCPERLQQLSAPSQAGKWILLAVLLLSAGLQLFN